MRALVVRHYKTQGNVSREIIGWGESPPAKDWKSDVTFVLRALRKSGADFEGVYTSELERARNTGAFYARGLKLERIRHDAALNEINYGDISRKTKRWVEKHLPGHKTDPDLVYSGGESFRQMQRRSTQFIESLAMRQEADTLLLVVHAGIIRGLVSYFLGLDYAKQLKRRITHRYIGDFRFEGSQCVAYDELGTRSGFVTDGVISPPWHRQPG
jgi:broad specificity phosphatase PhoE